MPTTTLVNPFTYAQVQSTGLDYSFAIKFNRVLARLAESFNPMDMGVAVMVGEPIGGMGADTIRVPDETNLLGVEMSALSGETDTTPLQSHALGYTDFTLGRYGVRRQNTYEDQMFALDQVAQLLSIDRFLAALPASVIATLRTLCATAVSGISNSVGSSAVSASLDLLIALSTAFNSEFFYEVMGGGRPKLWLHTTQIEECKASARTEPGFQNSGDFERIQGVEASQYLENFLGMGFDVIRSNSILTSAGAYQGGAYDMGGLGVATADTSRIRPTNGGGRYMSVPQLGLFGQELGDGSNQALSQMEGRLWIGATMGTDRVFRQRRFLSQAS